MSSNGDNVSCTEMLEPSDDDEYYMKQMADILDAFPKSGPPSHPVRLSDHLYMGNQDNADDVDLLMALGITHVLNMAGTRNFDLTRSPYPKKSGIKAFLMMQAEDYDEFDLIPYFLDANAFLSRAKARGGEAFVHCNYGVNRSGAVAAAYLMVSERKTLLRVICELKAKRSVVLTNVGFRRQLIRFARCRGLLDPVERPRSHRSPLPSAAKCDSSGEVDQSKTSSKTSEKEESKSTDEGTIESPAEDSETASNGNSSSSAATTTINKTGGETVSNGFHGLVTSSSSSSEPLNRLTAHVRPSPKQKFYRQKLINDVDAVIGNGHDTLLTNGYRQDTSSSSFDHDAYQVSRRPGISDTELLSSSSYSASPFPLLYSSGDGSLELLGSGTPSSQLSTSSSALKYYNAGSLDSKDVLDECRTLLDKYQSQDPYEELVYPGRAALRPASAGYVSKASTFVSEVKPRSYYYNRPPTIRTTEPDDDELNQMIAKASLTRQRLTYSGKTRQLLQKNRNSSVPSFSNDTRSYCAGRRYSTPGSVASTVNVLYQPRPYIEHTSKYWPSQNSQYSSPMLSHAYGAAYRARLHADMDEDHPYNSYESDSYPGEYSWLTGQTVPTRISPAPGLGPRSTYAALSTFII